MLDDLFHSGFGALLGFLLAQFVNVAKVGYDCLMAARLRIDTSEPLILSHMAEAGNGERYDERFYGFTVRNAGRRLATGVAFQLLKIETRTRHEQEFRPISNNTFDLALYDGESAQRGGTKVTLIPDSAVLVHLATWREDYGVLIPAVESVPHYYVESCSDAFEYRFTIAAFGDKGELARTVMTIR